MRNQARTGERALARRQVPVRADGKALVAAGVTVVLWASAFVAIRSAGGTFSPGALALGRLTCGSVVLGLVCLARGEGWPRLAAWPGIVTSGVLWSGVYMVALNWGEQKVDAGTAAMVVSLGPVIIALLSAWVLKEGLPAAYWPASPCHLPGSSSWGRPPPRPGMRRLAAYCSACWRRRRSRWRWSPRSPP